MQEPVRTILAATDLSRGAFAAVRRAALIARAHDAALELVYVIAESVRAWNELRAAFASVETDLRGSVVENLDALVAQIESETGVNAHAVVLDGKPFAQIAARSQAIGADVIVVGAHGENMATPLLGTTAHRVLRFSQKPVLLVKRTPPVEHAADPGYEHVVVATDFSDDSAQAATTAHRLFPHSAVTLLHAYQAPFEAKLTGRVPASTLDAYRQRAFAQAHLELESFAARVNLSDAPRLVRHGPAATRIREYAADTSADLIAVGSEEVPRLQNALLGSVSLDVVTQADCDVLLARTAAS
jgi:nucleotide-binding universal stress UspA family protein